MKSRILAIVVVGSLAALGAGCIHDEPMASQAAQEKATMATAPSFSELDAALSLNTADETVVKKALAKWNKDAASGTKKFAARGHEMNFVATVAPSLDDDQLDKLVNLMVDRRESRRDAARTHRKGRDGHMKKMSTELGLSEMQQTALQSLHRETRDKAEARRDAFDEGTITEDQLHADLEAIHQEAGDKKATILTADQMTKLDSMREKRFANRLERRVEHREDRMSQRADWLDSALELSDEQNTRVKAALATMHDAQDAAFKSVESGSMTRTQVREEMKAAREAFRASLEDILTPEQEKRHEILQKLVPGRQNHHA